MKWLILLTSLIPGLICGKEAVNLNNIDMDMITIYYDEHQKAVPMLTEMSEVQPALKTPSVRFGPLPCTCQDLTCGCCVNMNVQLFNFQRHACTNFTYDPYEFSIGMNMLWNDESIYKRNVSGKNPPPMCVQAPIPYLPTMDQCVRIFNIFTPGRNLHMCMNLETRIERVPVLVLQFDCMRMGADGVALLKPEAEGGLTTAMPEEAATEMAETPSEVAEIPQEADTFDAVDADKKKANQTHTNSTNTVADTPTIVVVLEEQEAHYNKSLQNKKTAEKNVIELHVNTKNTKT